MASKLYEGRSQAVNVSFYWNNLLHVVHVHIHVHVHTHVAESVVQYHSRRSNRRVDDQVIRWVLEMNNY